MAVPPVRQNFAALAQPHGLSTCLVWPCGLHRGLVQIVHRLDSSMRRVVASPAYHLLAGCGNTGSSQHQPRPASSRRSRRRRLARRSPANSSTLPNADRSIKFAIIGDSGRGSKEQHEVAAQMDAYRQRFDYKFVLMAGDNIYEGPATRGGLSAEVRGALQAAARRRRQVLRGARQPRRHQPDLLQAVQHGRQSLLHVRAAGRSDHALGHARALLRARQHLPRSRADCAGSRRK